MIQTKMASLAKDVIFADKLGKRYGPRWIFRNVTFSISEGECLVVSGPNGSGKSTLLRILAGLERPTEGSGGRTNFARATVGYMAPDLNLYPALDALDHLRIAAELRGVKNPDSAILLNRVGLLHHAEVRTSNFSTGMRARLKLALAIQCSPRVLLLDEPGANLDDEGKKVLAGLIEEQLTRGAVAIATNDVREHEFAHLELKLA